MNVVERINVPVLDWWGSDCDECGNTTPDSMRCDSCGSEAHTRPLYIEVKE